MSGPMALTPLRAGRHARVMPESAVSRCVDPTDPAAGIGRVVEVFADVRCPFAHVGLRRFVERRRALGREDVVLAVRAWPLELVNGAPLDAALIGRGVRALRSSVSPELFAGFEPGSLASTSMPALRLAAAAARADVSLGERISLAVRDAQFERGLDIADGDVLREVAERCGFGGALPIDDDDVFADWREGRERAVIGSPHFFVAGASWFCPALRIAHGADGLDVTIDGPRFDEFVARCFA